MDPGQLVTPIFFPLDSVYAYFCKIKKRLEYSLSHVSATFYAIASLHGTHISGPIVAPRHHHLFYLTSIPNMSVTPMAYSTANWHWKNKTVTPWAKEWFENELVTIQVEGSDGAVVSVERVSSVDGDVEVGRRKSKYVRAFSPASSPILLSVASAKRTIRSSREGAFFTFVKA